MARAYALLSEKSAMLNWLQLALNKGYYNDLMVLIHKAFDPFKENHDFQDIIARMREKREQFRL